MNNSFRLLFVLVFATHLLSCEKEEETIDFITFEEIDLGSDGYWNGSGGSGGFTSGNAFFPNNFTDWGDGFTSWSGFAASNHTDQLTPGYANQYSAYPGSGANGSEQFGLVYLGDTIVFAVPEQLTSVQVTNNTYAALSMAEGDDFAKKFSTGDYFHLVMTGIDEEGLTTGRVVFGLADFTSREASMQYITNVWNEVDLSSLGTVKRLAFGFASSDTSNRGINTPAYACIDNLKGTLKD